MIPKIIYANTIAVTLILSLVSIVYVLCKTQLYEYDEVHKTIYSKVDWDFYPFSIVVTFIVTFIVYVAVYYAFGLFSFFK